MKSQDNLQIAITLRETDWVEILRILKPACELRGGIWINWQQRVGEIIAAEINQKRAKIERSHTLPFSNSDLAKSIQQAEARRIWGENYIEFDYESTDLEYYDEQDDLLF
jgi:hypothetical protein